LKFEERQLINRPIGDVYHALSRPDLYLPSWCRGVLSASEVKNGQSGLTRFKVVGRDLVGKSRWHYEVTLSESGKVLSGRATGGPVPFTDSFRLQPMADGTTEVVHIQEIHPSGMFGLLAPVFSLVWPHLVRENLTRLKGILEARKSPVPQVAPIS
jgi:uncharacterized protein YndB with AHSA1/START domain